MEYDYNTSRQQADITGIRQEYPENGGTHPDH